MKRPSDPKLTLNTLTGAVPFQVEAEEDLLLGKRGVHEEAVLLKVWPGSSFLGL